jgi:ABC-type nickel/cobalt efflux system permease component RcnA
MRSAALFDANLYYERRKMKRPLSIALAAAVFTSVIAGALTLSTLKLMQPKSASSAMTAPAKEVASAAPTIIGTNHPVPVTPRQQLAASPKLKAFNSSATPAPRDSPLVENNSHHDAQLLADNASAHEAASPAELSREKAEQVRERAERLRSRVEDLYQAHRISETAYKQGQAEYQHELAKYEDQISKLRGATDGSGTSND